MISFSETIRRHPHSQGELLIGVPTLHRYDHLRRCLNGILAAAPEDAEIVVIDNGGAFKNDLSSRVQVVIPPCNLGTPASWNLIGDLADGREFLIFNDDVVPAVTTIRDMMQTPGWMVCSYAFGAFLVRQLLWTTVGRFDEFLWPMYFEDTDYQARMRLRIIEDSVDNDASKFPDDWILDRQTNQCPSSVQRIEGGILSLPIDGVEHIGGGSQTKLSWMEPWIGRTRRRFLRKWIEGDGKSSKQLEFSDGTFNLLSSPFDGKRDDPFEHYWSECYQNGWEPYLDEISKTAEQCESAILVGLHIGRFTLPFLRSKRTLDVHCYDWSRPEEWDFVMRLDELCGRKIRLMSRYDPRRNIPYADCLLVDENWSTPIAKRMILQQTTRIRKFIAFLGSGDQSCPSRDHFRKSSQGDWQEMHHNNGLTIFQRSHSHK